MNSRERVLKAFNHEEPDRVPIFCQSIMPNFYQMLMDKWEDEIEEKDIFFIGGKDFTIYKKLGFDSAWGAGGAAVWCPSEVIQQHPFPGEGLVEGEYLSVDGRVHKSSILLGAGHTWYVRPYLTTEEKADEWYDTYFDVEWNYDPNMAKNVNEIIKNTDMTVFVPTCGLQAILEPIWEGIGLGLLGKLLRKNKSKVKRYIDLRTKKAVLHAKLAAEADFDVYNLCDDTAFKNNTVIDPKIHRELVIPAYKQICNEIRKAGKKVFFHSDGFTEPYFEGLIEAGFHGVESLEPFAGMNLKHLKEKYGDKLCLIGNMDVSELLPYGTPEEVMNVVKQNIKDAGAGGGYILSPCTDITDSCKFENIQAMIAAVHKYGNYPLKL